MEDILEALNGMKGRPWKKCNEGKGLKESDVFELLNQPSSRELHKIIPKTTVRSSFPNLCVMRNRAAKLEISICDAVTKALADGNQVLSPDTIVSSWKRYKKQPIF